MSNHPTISYDPKLFDPFKHEDNVDNWYDLHFPEIMWGLGFEMDREESFFNYAVNCGLSVKKPNNERERKRNDLYILEHAPRQIVGNYLFSYFRYLTHWAYCSHDPYDLDYLRRIITILEKLYNNSSE